MSLRLWIISAHYPPISGGVSDYTMHLSRALRACSERHEVHLLTSKTASASEGIVPYFATASAAEVAGFPDAIGDLRAGDIVHLQYTAYLYGWQHDGLPRALRRLRSLGVRLVVTFHELWDPIPWRRPARLPIVLTHRVRARQVLQLVQAAILTVPSRAERVRRLTGGRLLVRCIPVGDGLDAPDMSRAEARARLGVPDSELMLASFGLVDRERDYADLIRAAGALQRQGWKMRLSIVGEQAVDRGLHALLARARAECPEPDRIEFTGRLEREAAAAHLAAADLLVQLHKLGAADRNSSFVSCLAAGRAIVTTRGGDTPAELAQCGAAVFVRRHDLAELTSVLARLAAQPEVCARMGQAARGLFERRHAWLLLAHRHLELYRDLSARGGCCLGSRRGVW